MRFTHKWHLFYTNGNVLSHLGCLYSRAYTFLKCSYLYLITELYHKDFSPLTKIHFFVTNLKLILNVDKWTLGTCVLTVHQLVLCDATVDRWCLWISFCIPQNQAFMHKPFLQEYLYFERAFEFNFRTDKFVVCWYFFKFDWFTGQIPWM